MLDFGFPELLVIIALAVIVVGPNEIPTVMRTFGRIVRRLQYVRYAISQQFEDMMNDAELGDISQQVNFESRAPKGQNFDEALADEGDEYASDYDVMEPLDKPQKPSVEVSSKNKGEGRDE